LGASVPSTRAQAEVLDARRADTPARALRIGFQPVVLRSGPPLRNSAPAPAKAGGLAGSGAGARPQEPRHRPRGFTSRHNGGFPAELEHGCRAAQAGHRVPRAWGGRHMRARGWDDRTFVPMTVPESGQPTGRRASSSEEAARMPRPMGRPPHLSAHRNSACLLPSHRPRHPREHTLPRQLRLLAWWLGLLAPGGSPCPAGNFVADATRGHGLAVSTRLRPRFVNAHLWTAGKRATLLLLQQGLVLKPCRLAGTPQTGKLGVFALSLCHCFP
jgi:hypothetical protein